MTEMTEPALQREEPIITKADGYFRDEYIEAYGHTILLDRSGRPLVRIDAPSFYQDPEFVRWLQSEEYGPATWHKPRSAPPDEGNDVFIYYGGADWDQDRFSAESSDYPGTESTPGIPEPIFAAIAEAVKRATGSYGTECIVWIANLEF